MKIIYQKKFTDVKVKNRHGMIRLQQESDNVLFEISMLQELISYLQKQLKNEDNKTEGSF